MSSLKYITKKLNLNSTSNGAGFFFSLFLSHSLPPLLPSTLETISFSFILWCVFLGGEEGRVENEGEIPSHRTKTTNYPRLLVLSHLDLSLISNPCADCDLILQPTSSIVSIAMKKAVASSSSSSSSRMSVGCNLLWFPKTHRNHRNCPHPPFCRRRPKRNTTNASRWRVPSIQLLLVSLHLCLRFPTAIAIATAIATTTTTTTAKETVVALQQLTQQQRYRQQQEHLIEEHDDDNDDHEQPKTATSSLGPGAGVGGQHAQQLVEQQREDALRQKQALASSSKVDDDAVAAAVAPSSSDSDSPLASMGSRDSQHHPTRTTPMIVGILVGSLLGTVLVGVGVLRQRTRQRKFGILSELEQSMRISMTGHRLFNRSRRSTSSRSNSWFSSMGSSASSSGDSFFQEGHHDDDDEGGGSGSGSVGSTELVAVKMASEWGEEITHDDRMLFHPRRSSSIHSLQERDTSRGRDRLNSSFKGSRNNKTKNQSALPKHVGFRTPTTATKDDHYHDAAPATDLSELL